MMYVSQITELYAPSTLISANGLGMRQGRHALDQACITHVRVLVVKILYFKILYIEMCVKTIDHYTTPDHMYNFRPYIVYIYIIIIII